MTIKRMIYAGLVLATLSLQIGCGKKDDAQPQAAAATPDLYQQCVQSNGQAAGCQNYYNNGQYNQYNGMNSYPTNNYGNYTGYNSYNSYNSNFNGCGYGRSPFYGPYGLGCVNASLTVGVNFGWNFGGNNMYRACNMYSGCPIGTYCDFSSGSMGFCRY